MAISEAELRKRALDPSTTSDAYDIMAPKWRMIDALLGGTATMRAMGETYLPKHPHETPENYKNRLAATTLLNMTELTLESLVGKPFSDPLKLKGEPAAIATFQEDVDMQGTNLHVFARGWMREGIAKGFSHVLIDMPKTHVPEGVQRTLADDQAENMRPYWSRICPENVLFISYSDVSGQMQPNHVRLFEPIVVRYGFTEVQKIQIRVLEPGTWMVYQQRIDANKKVFWDLIDSGVTGLNYIPFVTFYANEEGPMLAKPPLEDLAHLNIRHWQSTSDQMNILTVARFPMLAVSGAHDIGQGNNMTIGPRQLLATRAENGKFYYVEHSGAAIESGAKDIEKIEQDMAAYGAEFLRKRPGGTTATARALDSAEASSPLQDMTLRFKDSLEHLISMTADWMKEPDTTEVIIATDFGPDDVKDVDMRTLAEMRRNRDISRDQFIIELQRRGALADDFDAAKNLLELQSEITIASPFATGVNVDGATANGVDNSIKNKPLATAPAAKPAAKKKTAEKKKSVKPTS